MEIRKYFNLNLLITLLLLALAFIAWDLIFGIMVWIFEGLKSLVRGGWWTLLLYVVLAAIALMLEPVQVFVDTVIERVSGWFKKKDDEIAED